jgi:hypothetical protein
MPYGNSKRTKIAWKKATVAAERQGFNDFTAGSPGAALRGQIAEKVAAKPKRKGKR